MGGTLSRVGASFGDWLGLRNVLHFSQDNLERLETVTDDVKMFDSIIANTVSLMNDKPKDQFILGGLYSGDEERYRLFAERFFEKPEGGSGRAYPYHPLSLRTSVSAASAWEWWNALQPLSENFKAKPYLKDYGHCLFELTA